MNLEPLLSSNLRAELASRNFAEFVTYLQHDYSMQWFHKLISDKINEFEKGNIKKLMLFLPPQHGKTELTTRKASPYFLGKNPNRKIAIATYNATLAARFNRDIQRNIDNERYHEVFPNTYLNESNVVTVSQNYLRNSEIFEIVGHKGFVKTVGRGGALTSTTVDIGIIDDPIKDRAEAMSPTIRESLWSWYQDVFETRLHNDSQQILIQTRWHEEDLAGRLLQRDNDWEVVVLEAIKETNYPYDPREMGEALWPEKHSLERIQKIKQTSPITFNSLYQQSPRPNDEMGIFWTRRMLEQCRVDGKPALKRIIVSIDPATTSNKDSDKTGIVVMGLGENNHIYILDDKTGTYTPQQWAATALRAVEFWGASAIIAEKNQGGEMIEAVLRQYDKNIRIKLVQVKGSKAQRAEPLFSKYEQNEAWHVGYFEALELEMITFNPDHNPISPNRVDALSLGFAEMHIKKTGFVLQF